MNELARLPSVERLVQAPEAAPLVEAHGRRAVVEALRAVLAGAREAVLEGGAAVPAEAEILASAARALAAEAAPSLRPVLNLTGTVLHTNLGRAPLPEAAVDAVAAVARGASNLEFSLDEGRRGDRDDHVEDRLRRLTGAEAATVVNNNAAAVLLVLDTLARGREAIVSRGELIEIGGAFRMPEIMEGAGVRLREVGTTNRTHARDFEGAIGEATGLVLKVHKSNYEISGFTKEVPERELAAIARARGIPFAVDLGSGSLADLAGFGLPHEPTPRACLEAGADLVTFSGDKLLGGPQAGLVVGRADLVARLKRNPLKRALRCDKMTIAALSEVLRLHLDPPRLATRLPALRLLTRPEPEIRAMADALMPAVASALSGLAAVERVECASQIGSGAQPVDLLPSAGLAIAPLTDGGVAGPSASRILAALRRLPLPVVGRIAKDRVVLDLRCLEDPAALADQLPALRAALSREAEA
ncbi:L-seryl-tRNA(Sec) selenium transferase [Lutibaculum baratangense]|uniref:L-seryl-tRNA(Sec) selenium transferase n=1 Tax=Lutibaculum baratangense AMV1 TaxID=631454 RepID=V4QWX0_9HYPH|nr:L-seryl-tRNA(Sec) selenium transferase [Lutibaculum baratangense]ESR24267.1 L-seryl-tRNA(Sec) selenium transferase [Lutibaculum baratangense AMV1]